MFGYNNMMRKELKLLNRVWMQSLNYHFLDKKVLELPNKPLTSDVRIVRQNSHQTYCHIRAWNKAIYLNILISIIPIYNDIIRTDLFTTEWKSVYVGSQTYLFNIIIESISLLSNFKKWIVLRRKNSARGKTSILW